MRILTTALLALAPLTAFAGGHGTFYVCEAEGMEAFTIEMAARDCTVDRAKAKVSSEDPTVCDFGEDGLGKVTLASDLSLTVEKGGAAMAGMCRPR